MRNPLVAVRTGLHDVRAARFSGRQLLLSIVTQFSGSGSLLQTPHTLTLSYVSAVE